MNSPERSSPVEGTVHNKKRAERLLETFYLVDFVEKLSKARPKTGNLRGNLEKKKLNCLSFRGTVLAEESLSLNLNLRFLAPIGITEQSNFPQSIQPENFGFCLY
jgi:hypothetical protein